MFGVGVPNTRKGKAMKTPEERDIEMVRALEAGRAWQRENNKQQNKVALLLIPTIVVMFILPEFIPSPFDVMVMGFGSAISLTTLVLLRPASFRGRSGSLRMAIGLVTAMWLGAAVTTVLSLIGRH